VRRTVVAIVAIAEMVNLLISSFLLPSAIVDQGFMK
jgi:hypothetical protein